MTEDEAGDIMFALGSTFQKIAEWPDSTMSAWFEDLAKMDYAWAQLAVRKCRDNCTHTPSWAEFREFYRQAAAEARDPSRQDYRPAIGEGVLSRSEHAERVRAVRKILQGGPEHDHRKGADHCPVCSKHDRTADGLHSPGCARCKALGRQIYNTLRKDPA